MNRRITAVGLALSSGLVLAVIQSGTASGVQPHHASTSVARHAAATTKADQRKVEQYWTAARMKHAIPMGAKKDPQKGKPGGGTGGSTAVQQPAQPRFGKVFFTEKGLNYVCSGTATASANNDLVTTAGHCVNEGPGAYVTNFAFVPAYDHGSAPYGTWTAKTLVTTSEWASSGDFDYDIGFAVMNNLGGKTLTAAVGSYPIAFNQPRGAAFQAFGYPAAKPFDGASLWSCSGTVVQDTYGGSQDQGLGCNMTGGSSGGGWISNGALNSVTSFGYTGIKNILWGPYFGSTIQAAYNTAQNTH